MRLAAIVATVALATQLSVLGGRRIGLGVQFQETVLYRPDLGFGQESHLNSTAIQSQIERFLKDGKKPTPHKDGVLQPDIMGLQIVKSDGDDVAIYELQTSEVVVETTISTEESSEEATVQSPVLESGENQFLSPSTNAEESSERNSSSVVLLCFIGSGLVVTLTVLYYKGAVLF